MYMYIHHTCTMYVYEHVLCGSVCTCILYNVHVEDCVFTCSVPYKMVSILSVSNDKVNQDH